MSMSRKLKKKLLAAAAALTVMSAGAANVSAFPMTDNGTVEVGNATGPGIGGVTFDPNGNNLYTIGGNTLINWGTFGIPPGCTMTFDMNGNIVVNQVTGASYSPIEGTLAQQNGGHLFLINPNGITVASGAQINGTAITLAAVQTLSATQFSDLCVGNPVTLTPAGAVSVETIYNSVSSEYNVLGQAVSVPDPSYLSMGGTREALSGDTSATLKNNSLTVGGTPPTPPGPTPPGPTPDVGPKTEEEAKQFVDQTKGSVDTLTESQRGNDAAVKAAQEALQNSNQGNTATQNDTRLTGVQDHVYVVQTGAEQNSSGLDVGKIFDGLTVSEATTRSKNIAKQYVDALQSGDKAKAAVLKEEMIKADEALRAAKNRERDAEMAKREAEQKALKDAAVKAAQEKLDQIRKDAFDKYADWQKAQHDLSAAEEKAELAARDYLNALKTGDPEIIAAYKERLQEANDALLEAKRNEEAAKQATYEASSNVARAQAELNNVQNNFTYSSGASGENQQSTQQTVEQPTQQQTAEQPVQQQSGGETNISFNSMLKAKLSSLTQKEAELAKQLEQKNSAAIGAAIRYNKAKNSGASQEELDRLKTEYDKAMAESNRLDKEHAETKAELDSTRALVIAVEKAKMTPPELAQKEAELAKQLEQKNSAAIGAAVRYNEAKKSGASQEELDRLKAEYDKAMSESNRLEKEHAAAKAELEDAREAAWRESVIAKWEANKAEQQTVEQPVQQQGGVETMTTEQKSAEQSAKDAAVKAAQENLDQTRKEGFDKYAALQKAQYDLSAAEDKAEQAANDYLLALKSGDKDTIAAFKEELQKANDALLEAKRNEEAAQQGLKEAGSNIARAQTELNNAQNNFNDSGAAGGEYQQPVQQQSGGETEAEHEAFMRGYRDAEEEWKAEQKREEAREKAEKAANDYLLALKSGDKDTIAAFKEELQKANDALLEAKRNEEAAKQATYEASSNVARAQAELNNVQNNFTYSSGASGENQQSTQQQTVGQQTTQQTVEQPIQQQSGSETSITTQDPLKSRVTELEQKVNDLTKQYRDGFDARDQANLDYLDAKERGASQEEIDRLKAKYDELAKEQGRILDERRTAKAELQAARAEANAAE